MPLLARDKTKISLPFHYQEEFSMSKIKMMKLPTMKRGKKTGAFQQEGKFIRKGKTGDWKNHFSPELNNRVDACIQKNLAGIDLTFVTELEYQD